MIQTFRPIPSAQLRLLVFDLDGTLVDSRQDLANSVNAMLAHFHRPPLDDATISRYIGDGAPTLVRRSLGFSDTADLHHKEEEFVEEALIFFLDYYREHKLDFTYVYPGVFEALAAIRAARPQCNMAVLSNKPVGPSRAIVQALKLAQHFPVVYGGNSFETKKPDPLGVQMLLQEFHCKPQEAVIVGDSYVDILTARNTGIFSLGVTYGLAPQTLLTTPGDIHVDTAEEWGRVLSS